MQGYACLGDLGQNAKSRISRIRRICVYTRLIQRLFVLEQPSLV